MVVMMITIIWNQLMWTGWTRERERERGEIKFHDGAL